MPRIALISLYLLCATSVKGNALSDSTILSTEFPISSKSFKFTQTISYETTIDTLVDIRLNCYYFSSKTDSVHLYDLTFEKQRLKAGAGYIDLPFSKSKSMHKMDADFFEIINRFKMVPAGRYKTNIEILSKKVKDSILISRNIEQYVDSNLSQSSGLKEKMNAAVAVPKTATKQAQKKSLKRKKTTIKTQRK